jgi:antitoxin component of RelBE/YafQ-DinJ toxin-antitoxin module
MSKSAAIRVRHGGPEFKGEAKSIFEKIGLVLSSVVSYFYPKAHTRLASTAEGNIPNRKTRRVLRDSQRGKNLVRFENEEAFFKDLGM